MKVKIRKPQVVREDDVAMVGPGYDEDHYISVPNKVVYDIEDVGHIGVCHMQPGDEICVFAIQADDDGTAPHQYGPCEFYYILEGEFTVWWGKDASDLEKFYRLAEGD